MNLSLKKFLLSLSFLVCLILPTNAEENYAFGGAKIFNYGIESSDLQAINTSLVNLGFSSSTSETDNIGVGFEIGAGITIAEGFALEGSFVNYGTLEITTTTTGPAENIKTEISGDGIAFGGALNVDGLLLRAGMHSWDFEGKVTASLGTSSESLGTGTDPYFGIGYISDNFYTTFDYYGIEDGDITSLSIGYSAQF